MPYKDTETETDEIYTTGYDGRPKSMQDTCMNDSGENGKYVTERKTEVLSVKTKSRIGFWNV